MDRYVTGGVIRTLREARSMTQEQLAERLHVSGKTVSKWETGRGLPDITLLEPLAAALGVSLIELVSGGSVTNRNRAGNMLRTALYVCPVCGNVITSSGEAVLSCCGVTLPPLEAEAPDEAHALQVSVVDGEYYVTCAHPMEKTHHVSFLLALSDDALQLVKLYPEGDAAATFRMNRVRSIYACCNRHGLFVLRLPVRRPPRT